MLLGVGMTKRLHGNNKNNINRNNYDKTKLF